MFVTNASELQGLNAMQIAQKLAIPENSSGFRIFEFPTDSVTEIALIGRWVSEAGQLVPDATSSRIERLIKDYLTEICHDSSGWLVLYRDLSDNRLWELAFQESESHGGGAPQLRLVSFEEAKQKYKIG